MAVSSGLHIGFPSVLPFESDRGFTDIHHFVNRIPAKGGRHFTSFNLSMIVIDFSASTLKTDMAVINVSDISCKVKSDTFDAITDVFVSAANCSSV